MGKFKKLLGAVAQGKLKKRKYFTSEEAYQNAVNENFPDAEFGR